MNKIGKNSELKVISVSDEIVQLDAGLLGHARLPSHQAPAGIAEGDVLTVFLFPGEEGSLRATTQLPKCQVGEFACLKVVNTTSVGAFVDNGMDKDVLVPFAEQHRPMEMGHSYIVTVYLGRRDGRLTASSKIDKFLDEDQPHAFKPRQAVDLLIANSTELGYRTIINNSHWGVLYRDEVFRKLSYGQRISGFIKQIRPDGKIDLTLQGGQETRDRNGQKVLRYLERHDGFADVHDKSDPERIKLLFGMSKGAFKKAIGQLYKQRLIVIEKQGIRLNSDK